MGKILIIDDDEMMCKAMCMLAEQMGHESTYANTINEGLEKTSSVPFDVVLLDVMMPDGNGLDVLPKIGDTSSKPEVIIITTAGDPDGAELAIRSGAWDYIEKTSSVKEMMLPLSRALQYRQEKLSKLAPVVLKRERIVGNSPRMKACLDLLAQAAVSDVNVLITGETGTGKELFARAIHFNSPRNDKGSLSQAINGNRSRADKHFVVVDCTALPETLVESVLFGHERGAFTGADKTQEGLIKQADGGTLFLDEIGELPLATQKAFLRVLQERRFRPVGGKVEIESNFRLIVATNRDLNQMTEQGEFRKDLLFRLRSLTIDLPPLRERPEDIKDLVRFHVARLCDRYGIATKGFSSDFFDALMAYDWPGNVRELVNTLDGAIAVAGNDPTLYNKHLPVHIRIQMARTSVSKGTHENHRFQGGNNYDAGIPNLKDFRLSLEKEYFENLVSFTNGDARRACQISGLSRSRFYELLSKHNLSIPKN
jgi:two-component system NtrC family response regulator